METKKPELTSGIINLNALATGLNQMGVQVTTLYLTMFMTDYLGIDPVAMASGMLIAKTFDFIVSLVAGVIIEKVNMKHGKYLSWLRLITVTCFFGNIIQMLDTSAFVGNSTVRLIIVMFAYMMFHGSMNFYATARAAMIPKLAGANMENRKKITARQSQVGSAVSIISSAITLPMVTFVQKVTGSDTAGYFIVILIFSTCFSVVNLLFCKKAAPFDPYDPTPAAAKARPSVKQMVTSVVTNKQMLILFIAFVVTGLGNQVYAGVTTYFFRATGNFGKYTIVLTARSICAFLASMVAPSIGKKLGKKGALIFSWSLSAAAGLLIYFFAYSNGEAHLVPMAVAMCLKQSANYFYMVFNAIYWLDCGEYGYATTGVDNRTMSAAVMNWPMKISSALGGSMVGYVLAWAGYNAPDAAAGTSASFTYMGRFMAVIGLVPVITLIVGIIVIALLYKMTDEEAAKYAQMNVEREKAAKEAQKA